VVDQEGQMVDQLLTHSLFVVFINHAAVGMADVMVAAAAADFVPALVTVAMAQFA
jgi:hypothetical protein